MGPLALFLLPLSQSDAGPTAIFIDELHARGLEHAADGLIIDPGELGLAGGELGAADGGDADLRLVASSWALQRMSALAALIWALVKGLGDILTSPQVMHI